MFDLIDPLWIFSGCVFFAVFACIDAANSLFFGATNYRTQVNRRLERAENETSRLQTVIDLRRDRGLTMDADWQIAVIWLNRLILQSGLTLGIWRVAAYAAGSGVAGLLAGYYFASYTGAIVGLLGAGFLLPLLVLKYLRRKRVKKFTDQLAEAIDIIVRSLRAGHPVPSAIKMAARELPDPIGTEFGMVQDEITFGLGLESAMRNMYQRVGQEDLPLMIASIAIQTSSGGNLTEILENLSNVIRMRVKMRRKVGAISAEGRISAIILSATPFAMFGIINLISPSFYGDKWENPTLTYGLGGAFIWMMIGNLWMRKMINFKL